MDCFCFYLFYIFFYFMKHIGGYSFSQSAGDINEILPAAIIMKRMVEECIKVLAAGGSRLVAQEVQQEVQQGQQISLSTPHYRLWTSPGSRSSRVLWTMIELDMMDEVELITMPFPPRMTYSKYLKTNILGTIPFFESTRFNEKHIQMTEVSLVFFQSLIFCLLPCTTIKYIYISSILHIFTYISFFMDSILSFFVHTNTTRVLVYVYILLKNINQI